GRVLTAPCPLPGRIQGPPRRRIRSRPGGGLRGDRLMPGPLEGVRVVELAGIGPAPFCGMILADLGAEVVRVDRPERAGTPDTDPLNRGKKSIAADLKSPDASGVALRVDEMADVRIGGCRPGVAERLGVGPAECHARNPRLVYGRMTGWGQDGLLAETAGHDIDYIPLSGALASIGPASDPVGPLNLGGDFGGGGRLPAVGVLAALTAGRSGAPGPAASHRAARLPTRSCRATSSETSAGEGCSSPSVFSRLSPRRAPGPPARWWTPRWSTARRCSWHSTGGSSPGASGRPVARTTS